MKRIAVDVVILPDPTLDSVAIAANRDLVAAGAPEIRLGVGRGEGRPHISLAMGVVDADNIDALTVKLARIVADHESPPLRATHVLHHDATDDRVISVLQIQASDELVELHTRAMRALEPFLSPAVEGVSLCLEGEPVHAPSLEWIAAYQNASSYERFDPHLTLGYGRIELPELPRVFPSGTLALCHLGNECTCRRVLVSLA